MPNIAMVLDTETTSLEGRVYDIGYTIANAKGSIFVERSWLVNEIFTNAYEMMGAFYARKFFTHYAQALQDGLITLKPWLEIVDLIRTDFYDWKVNILAAYNLPFDKKVMRITHQDLGGKGPILGPARQLCLWRFAKQTRLNTKTYAEWCKGQGLLTATGKPKTTAECAYRYFFGEWEYQEPHTALGDALMETKLMARCFQAKQKTPWL